MFKRKCPGCAKKVDKSFSYCPHCGTPFKARKEKEDFGLIGRDDMNDAQPQPTLPFGMEKMVNSLIKQLEKQMNDMNLEPGKVPRGIKIQFSTRKPQEMQQIPQAEMRREVVIPLSKEEIKRRAKLPKVEAESAIKRLADKIIYIIKTPGVKEKKDVAITTLASGIEIKAYSKDYCYVKYIPLTVEIIEYHLKDEKLFLEIKA